MLSDVLRLQADVLGARAEVAASLFGSWLLNRMSPNGGGNRPVITFPGFLAADGTLSRLNSFLNANGFEASSWGEGRNLGPRESSWEHYLARLEHVIGDEVKRLADLHSAPVSLIGQSLGGVYARELALQMPEHIDRVIMLGSPTFHPYVSGHHNRVVAQFGFWLNRGIHTELAGRRGLLHWDADHPPLPCVAIHSPIDGVVAEISSVIPDYIVDTSEPRAPRENLRVFSTHVGMGVNPWVLLAIADRLAQDKADWQPFNPNDYFVDALRWMVPLLYPAQPERSAKPALHSLVETS
jgi:pimeloyl-ACP methyl ester carboxylesterase